MMDYHHAVAKQPLVIATDDGLARTYWMWAMCDDVDNGRAETTNATGHSLETNAPTECVE